MPISMRSFSKLKIIIRCKSLTMSQDRLVGLALILVENERAREIDFSKLIDIFSQINLDKCGLIVSSLMWPCKLVF